MSCGLLVVLVESIMCSAHLVMLGILLWDLGLVSSSCIVDPPNETTQEQNCLQL